MGDGLLGPQRPARLLYPLRGMPSRVLEGLAGADFAKPSPLGAVDGMGGDVPPPRPILAGCLVPSGVLPPARLRFVAEEACASRKAWPGSDLGGTPGAVGGGLLE